MRRRDFLMGLGFLGLQTFHSRLPAVSHSNQISTGGIDLECFEPEMMLGHKLRDPSFFKSVTQGKVPVKRVNTLIIGAGVGSLSCARALKKKSHSFQIIEAASFPGGTSAKHELSGIPVPLGAHYLVAPPEEAWELREFLKETGVIKNFELGLPAYHQAYLLNEDLTKARTYKDNSWLPGINEDISKNTSAFRKFQLFTRFLSSLKGEDGKRWFALPTGRSSKDPKALELLQVPFTEYLKTHGMWDEEVESVVNYACMDDYGCLAHSISAWVGFHYFSCRDSTQKHFTITKSSGNGHLVDKLFQGLETHFRGRTVALKSEYKKGKYETVCYNETQGVQKFIHSNLVFGGKLHALKHFFKEFYEFLPNSLTNRSQLPWLVTQLVFHQKTNMSQVCWDNVIHKSFSVGYIYANHTLSKTPQAKKILTHFIPTAAHLKMDGKELGRLSKNSLSELVLKDFKKSSIRMIPNLEKLVFRRLVHGMGACPNGFVLPSLDSRFRNGKFEKLPEKYENIYLVNTDSYGLPLFEEGFQAGYEAAKAIQNS